MIDRTIREALEHANQQREYAMPDAPNLVVDFIVLADELNRLRRYDCDHPRMSLRQIAYVSPEAARRVWEPLGMEFDGTPVEAHSSVTNSHLHLPQTDGTCIVYNY